MFRGPKRKAEGDYIAFLGGAETFGKFVARPFPRIVEEQTGQPALNLGMAHAGPDAYLADDTLLRIASGARAVVLQVPGAHNITNRFYAVHPRRNDRFLKASDLMKTVFGGVDFAEIAFTRHLLAHLRMTSPDRFAMLVDELRSAWAARMIQLVQKIDAPVILTWFAAQAPGQGDDDLDRDPLLVTADMLEALRPHVADIVICTPGAEALAEGRNGLIFEPTDAAAAARALPSAAHGDLAQKLVPVLGRVMGKGRVRQNA